jgi:hypothetical protein
MEGGHLIGISSKHLPLRGIVIDIKKDSRRRDSETRLERDIYIQLLSAITQIPGAYIRPIFFSFINREYIFYSHQYPPSPPTPTHLYNVPGSCLIRVFNTSQSFRL